MHQDPKFSCPKGGSLFIMYCVCTQGRTLLQEGLGISLRMYFCPPVLRVTVWVEATDAECLWCPKSTFALDRLCPVTLTGGSCEVFKWNPVGLKGQWWKMMSAVFSFLVHRFFSVAWTVLPVSLLGMYHMEFAFLHWGFATLGTKRKCWSPCSCGLHSGALGGLCYSYWKCLL